LLHFLHGNSFCGLVYKPMLETLSQHFDLWLSDVQGHGDSDAGSRFVGWNQCASLAFKAFDQQQAAFSQVPKFAVGHSFGGVLTGLILADHPQLFQRAVLLDPVLFPPSMALAGVVAQNMRVSRFLPLARASKQRRAHWPSRQAAIEALHERGTYKGWTSSAMKAFAEHALRPADDGSGVVLKCPPRRESEIFSSVPKGMWKKLNQLATPTLVLHGNRTFPFIAPSAMRWSTNNPHVTTKEVVGNHCFMQCEPDLAANEVSRFLLAQ
jgi:pimeloyl-ACP methyl ester carboxylesterase